MFPVVALAQVPDVRGDFVCTVKRPSSAFQERVT
jgi:hypothetical protein